MKTAANSIYVLPLHFVSFKSVESCSGGAGEESASGLGRAQESPDTEVIDCGAD